MRNATWTDAENKTIVRIYFEMLAEQQAGHEFIKSDYRRNVEKETGRSKAAVEFKFCNISAILEEKGHPFVQGYVPFPHYQLALKEAVENYGML
jgi:hypothetical protein